MAAHKRDIIAAQTFCEIAALLHISDEQIRVAEVIGNIPHRNIRTDKASRMNDGPERCAIGNTEGKYVLGVGMYDDIDIWARL